MKRLLLKQRLPLWMPEVWPCTISYFLKDDILFELCFTDVVLILGEKNAWKNLLFFFFFKPDLIRLYRKKSLPALYMRMRKCWLSVISTHRHLSMFLSFQSWGMDWHNLGRFCLLPLLFVFNLFPVLILERRGWYRWMLMLLRHLMQI